MLFVVFTIAVNPLGSQIAISDNILRLTSTLANFNPCINFEYEISFNLAAALIRAIHNFFHISFYLSSISI